MGMMTALRQRMAVIMMILVVAFVITIVFSWGMGGFKGKYEPGVIGKVDGVKIEREYYENIIDNRFNYERQNSEQPLNENTTKQIRQEVWDGLVTEILLEKYRTKAGIIVSDKEVAFAVKNYPLPAIRQNPVFQDSMGNFNQYIYEQFLLDPIYESQVIMLEQNTRQQLEQQKIIQRLSSVVHVSEEEAKEAFIRDNTLADASYIVVNAKKLDADSSVVSEDDINNAYKEQKEDFLTEETRTIQYVLFEDSPSSDDSMDASELILDIKDRIERGADFEEIAREYSEDASASEGGDLGWFGAGKMVKEFEEAAFNTEPGKMVGPVQSQFGFHLIRVDDRKGSGDDLEVKARHILVKIERSTQTLDNIKNGVEGFREEADESDFETAAKVYKVKIDTLEKISNSGFIPKLGQNLAATEFLFIRPVGDVSPVYNFGKGFVVMRVISVEKEHYRPLEEVRSKLFRELLKEYQFELAEKKIQKAYEFVLEHNDLEAGALAIDEEVKKSRRPFKVDEFVSGIGRDYDFTQTVFKLEPGKISKPFKGKKGYIIAQLDSLQQPNMDLWESQKEAKMGEMLRTRQQDAYDAWLVIVKDKAKIEDFRYLYYTQY
ncbi:MAG: peptidylprolyl isomerase [Candidatus Electryonea clarkiae]|nr:peptidylprolyl isomerase [Candidatus Electryonea clarkiae]MDP8286618.1 peptidylprolyl isomerase [Candidatus Electryonea clarkiae]